MKKPITVIAIAILALMLGACASTNDTADRPEHTTATNNNPNEIPSHAERQDQIAYTDISAHANTKEVVTTETPVLQSSATVINPVDSSVTYSDTSTSNTSTGMVSSSTANTTDNTATMSGTGTISSNTNNTSVTTSSTNSSMTSSSTTDTDDEDTATASRTRMRKD